MSNSKIKVIFTMSLALELKKLGHKVVEIMPNPNKPEFNCWAFEVDETFIADLEELKGFRRKE